MSIIRRKVNFDMEFCGINPSDGFFIGFLKKAVNDSKKNKKYKVDNVWKTKKIASFNLSFTFNAK